MRRKKNKNKKTGVRKSPLGPGAPSCLVASHTVLGSEERLEHHLFVLVSLIFCAELG